MLRASSKLTSSFIKLTISSYDMNRRYWWKSMSARNVVSKVYKFNQRVESPLWKCFCIFNWQFQSSDQSDWFNWSRKFKEERDFELVVSHFHKITYTYLNHSHIWILFIVVDEVRCNQAPLLGKQRKLHLKKRYANKCGRISAENNRIYVKSHVF